MARQHPFLAPYKTPNCHCYLSVSVWSVLTEKRQILRPVLEQDLASVAVKRGILRLSGATVEVTIEDYFPPVFCGIGSDLFNLSADRLLICPQP